MRDEGDMIAADCAETEDNSLSGRLGRIERVLGMNGGQYNRETVEKHAHYMSDRASGACGILGERVNQTRPATALEEIQQRIQMAVRRIYENAEMLAEVGIRVYGHLPSGASGSDEEEKQREPNGELEQTFKMLDVLDNAIDALQNRAVRLQNI